MIVCRQLCSETYGLKLLVRLVWWDLFKEKCSIVERSLSKEEQIWRPIWGQFQVVLCCSNCYSYWEHCLLVQLTLMLPILLLGTYRWPCTCTTTNTWYIVMSSRLFRDRVSVVDKTNVGDWLPKSGSGDLRLTKTWDMNKEIKSISFCSWHIL